MVFTDMFAEEIKKQIEMEEERIKLSNKLDEIKREYERKCAEEMANFEKTFNQPAQDIEEIDDVPQVKRKTNKRIIESRESSVEVIIEEDESDVESDVPVKKTRTVEFNPAVKPKLMRKQRTIIPVKEEKKKVVYSSSHKTKRINIPTINTTQDVVVYETDGSIKLAEDVFILPELAKQLKPHQVSGIRFMYNNIIVTPWEYSKNPLGGQGCILAHSMGLGKTIQVITFIDLLFRYTSATRVLIILPVNVLGNWDREFMQWLPKWKAYVGTVYGKLENRCEVISRWGKLGGVCIVGYETFRGLEHLSQATTPLAKLLHKLLIDPGPDLVVCDEGHKIKNDNTATTRSLKAIRTPRRILLTGYPLQNNLREYYWMVNFIRENLLGSMRYFNDLFIGPIEDGMAIDADDDAKRLSVGRTHLLIKRLEACVHRRSQNIFKGLLPNNYEYVLLFEKTEIQFNLYKNFIKYIQENRAQTNTIAAFSLGSKIWNHPTILMEYVNSPPPVKKSKKKIEEEVDEENWLGDMDDGDITNEKSFSMHKDISQWAEDVFPDDYDMNDIYHSYKFLVAYLLIKYSVENNEKVLVFSQHLNTLQFMETLLVRIEKYNPDLAIDIPNFVWTENNTFLHLEGATKAPAREEMVDRFNNTPDPRVFFISTKAGSVGINLIAASRTLIMDASWNPVHDAQAGGRTFRFGQTKQTYIYRFVMANSMENQVFNRQITKQHMFKTIVDQKNAKVQMSEQEFNHLLKYSESLDTQTRELESFNEVCVHGLCECEETDLNCHSKFDPMLKRIIENQPSVFTKLPFLIGSLVPDVADITQEDIVIAEERFKKHLENVKP